VKVQDEKGVFPGLAGVIFLEEGSQSSQQERIPMQMREWGTGHSFSHYSLVGASIVQNQLQKKRATELIDAMKRSQTQSVENKQR
jgi:hypothetical protein